MSTDCTVDCDVPVPDIGFDLHTKCYSIPPIYLNGAGSISGSENVEDHRAVMAQYLATRRCRQSRFQFCAVPYDADQHVVGSVGSELVAVISTNNVQSDARFQASKPRGGLRRE